jgi:GT2 family glycosyltransferase
VDSFTVVIPTRNRPAAAFELLRYLREELGWACPVVIVDQSDDGGEALASLLRDGRLAGVRHRPQKERGTGFARNAGASVAQTAWLILLDDDVWPTRDYLETLARYIAENPWLDAVQPGLKQRDEWDAYRQDPERWLAERRRKPPARKPPPPSWDAVKWFIGNAWTRYETLTIGVASGNLAISRRAFVGAGGFDEQIEGRGDDSEFGLRLWWYGYRVGVFPTAVAFHLREEHGGTRDSGLSSRWHRLLVPEPAVGWTYFHLKWFPGHVAWQMVREHALLGAKRPWTLPIKLVRLWRSFDLARERLRTGPRYMAPPVPRGSLVEVRDVLATLPRHEPGRALLESGSLSKQPSPTGD